MEPTMLTIDRLVDGINGEDPGGARLYMSQLRENETLSMLECFEDMLSGRLPVAPPPSSSSGNSAILSGSSGGSMAYRVPPSEFLKVLVEGSTTRLGGLHAVLQAIGRGDLQGRAASLCISEVRMCLSACASGGGGGGGGAGDGSRAGASAIHRRMPLAHLRELAGVCLSFSMDAPLAVRATAAGGAGQRGEEDANNRRVLMLEALPAVLGACCAVAAAEKEDKCDDNDDDDDDDDSESDSDSDRDQGEEERGWEVGRERGGGRGCGTTASATGAAAGKKGKGKGRSGDHRRSIGGGRSDGGIGKGARRSAQSGKGNPTGDGGGGFGPRGLPESGEAIMRDVTDALLDRPWPLRLALPLLVAFEEIYDLVELLDGRARRAGRPTVGRAGGRMPGKMGVWARVRSRLMEVVWMGGLDGADFTGVVRQVCVLCDTDGRRGYEHGFKGPSSPPRQESPGYDGAARGATSAVLDAAGNVPPGGGDARGGGGPAGSDAGAGRSGSWLSCLRQLYAAVPPEWVSTVELVLEQTLHQMPGVAESLLDAIQDARSGGEGDGSGGEAECGSWAGGEGASSPRAKKARPNKTRFGPGLGRTPSTPMGNDLALLILLLREASPLRACSLPLLPVGVDRGRRAESGIRRLLFEAGRRGSKGEATGPSGGDGRTPPECRGRAGALGGVRALLRAVLCSERDFAWGAAGSDGGGGGGGSSASSTGSAVVGGGGGGESSAGVVSERASQLLELALRWLEEGEEAGTGGKGEGGAELSTQDLASETISAVFDCVVEARPRLLRALLGGVFDRNRSGTACALSYMGAWEALMAQEAELECRRLAPHSQGVSDALGRLTLLPRGRARRIVESILPLADVCPTQASALISLCRKCSVQGESKGRLLTLHAVTCILAWNACRAKRSGGRGGGCLDQEGTQEDLVAMFRRAFEGGLETAARADALNLLAAKLAMPGPGDADAADQATVVSSRSTVVSSRATAAAAATRAQQRRGEVLLRVLPSSSSSSPVPPRSPPRGAALNCGPLPPPPAIDLSALGGLREFLAGRLFRFFADKDEVLDADGAAGGNDGDDSASVDGAGRGKGKQRARRRRGGRFRLVPLRLLEERVAPIVGHGGLGGGKTGGGDLQRIRGRGGGVVPRDAVGQLLKCCWALVPAVEESCAEIGAPCDDRVCGRGVSGAGKRAEVEAIAIAVLGRGKRRDGERGEGGGGKSTKSGLGLGVYTREGEALLAVVEFLKGGGGMETVQMVAPSDQRPAGYQEADDGTPPAPPACHPGVVSPLTALGVVVTLAEALVDCLMSGVSCPTATPSSPQRTSVLTNAGDGLHRRRQGAASNRPAAKRGRREPPPPALSSTTLWAVADAFTLLAAATRAADNIAAGGGDWRQQQPRTWTPNGLSEMIACLPAETLGLSRGGPEAGSTAGADEDDGDGGGGGGPAGRGGGKSRGRRRGGGGGGGGGGGDPVGQCSLLSAASALVFVREFLCWAASEEGVSPVALVAEGWDGGIGVWLGLIHSVQTLARALRTSGGGGDAGHPQGTAGGVSCGRTPSKDSDPSAEPIALAVFQLRAVVGTPSAALDFLNPSAAAAAAAAAATESPLFPKEYSPDVPSSPSPDCGPVVPGDGTGTGGTRNAKPSVECRASRRPPPGKMIAGFLKNMSERWKAALPWGLPSAPATRRVSPRLERGTRRRGGVGRESAAGSLKAEAEDLFFALRSELLRAERLVLSVLLVGPNATVAVRRWTMQAALASARRRRGEETAEAVGSERSRPSPPLAAGASANGAVEPLLACPTRQEPPESGSGPARAAPRRGGGVSTEGRAPGKGTAVISCKVDHVPEAKEQGAGPGLGGSSNAESGGRASGSPGVADAAPPYNGEENEWDGLGTLCRLAAAEMREGLEDGLSVKLSLAYLDLIELLGGAALERRPVAVAGAATAPCAADEKTPRQSFAGAPSAQRGRAIAGGGEERQGEDAGGVLLSIVACHAVSQSKLFTRLIRGAVKFDGVGASHCSIQARRTAAATLARLRVRDQELSPAVEGRGGDDDHAAEEGALLREIAQSPSPPPLERSAQLVVHCVRWIRARHGHKRGRVRIALFEEEDGEEDGSCEEADVDARDGGPWSQDIGTSNGDPEGDAPSGSDGSHGSSRYSSRPEEVKFASSRECFVAMRAALLEFEAALSSAGGGGVGPSTSSGGEFDVRGGSGSGGGTDGTLADILATVSFGLREVLSPAAAAPAATTTASTKERKVKIRKGKEADVRSSPGSAGEANAAADPASIPARAEQRSEHVKAGCKKDGGAAKDSSPLAPLDFFPDTVKLLLMRVLERVYLVGRGVTLTAAAVLAKPSSTATATIAAARSASPAVAAPSPPPPPPPCPSPPPSKRHRKQQLVPVANAGRPGDQAGGVPAKAPPRRAETSAAKRSRATAGGTAAVPATPPAADGWRSRSTRSKTAASASASASRGRGEQQGDRGAGANAARIAANRSKPPPSLPGPETGTTEAPEGPVNPLLPLVLPAVALASGDCLQLMLAARVWAEALRAKARRGGDDPCRKRASTLLFKIERCELEIGTAAHRARQLLEHFEHAKSGADRADGRRDGGGGSSKKRGRVCVGNTGGGGSGSGNSRPEVRPAAGTCSSGSGNGNRCDEALKSALGLLLSGADALAAWRRDSAANEKTQAAGRNQDADGGQKRRGSRQGREDAAAGDEGGGAGDAEGRGGSATRDRFGGASGKRSRSRGRRVRSRNVVIDGWLEEAGGGREDAFVDLEDFIEA